MSLVVMIPASNEEGYLGSCLTSLCEQRDTPRLYVIVSANGCTDSTVAIAHGQTAAFLAHGHMLVCLENPVPDKAAALNRAEAAIPPALVSAPRIYLDADIICDPDICSQLARVLETNQPAYATGKVVVKRSSNAITRKYAAVWTQTPFGRAAALGTGLFAVNDAGRRRWRDFPPMISDDTFVRWSFAPHERIEVPATFRWCRDPVSGLAALIRVRGRQDRLVQQVRTNFPELERNEDVPRPTFSSLARLAIRQPFGFLVYYTICLAARFHRNGRGWARGQ